jgi:hypothetical protein
MNITINVAKELYNLGFSYKHYEQNIHKGMVYYYHNYEWVIGGNMDEEVSDADRKIVAEGIWLPSEIHLIEWITDNDFIFSLVNQDGFFELRCKDSICGTEYYTKVPTLELAFAIIIKKILKKKERPFDTHDKVFGIIEK